MEDLPRRAATLVPSMLPRLRRSQAGRAFMLGTGLWTALWPGWIAFGTWSDTNSDGLNDTWTDPQTLVATALADMNTVSGDADGDGLSNAEEAVEGSNPYVFDTDYDGISDGDEVHIVRLEIPGVSLTNWDSDGDFISDYDEFRNFSEVEYTGGALPSFEFASYFDYDGDGFRNPDDPAPLDPDNYSSNNSIAWGAEAMADADSDGLLNFHDGEPYGPMDADGDGIPENLDPYPADYNNHSPINGIDWGGTVNNDDDSDGMPNHLDPSPYPPPADYDGDGTPDISDPFPLDPTNFSNMNGIAWNDTWSDDSDNDGFGNWTDPVPYSSVNRTNGHDWYGDIFGDADQDGQHNWEDLTPFPPDPDEDGDGLRRSEENYYGTSDLDVDCDDDGLTDMEELIVYSSNPLNAYSICDARSWDHLYLDMYLVGSQDADADGIPTQIEQLYGLDDNQPADAQGDLDSNGLNNLAQYVRGIALNADLSLYDADGDGMTDIYENYYQLQSYQTEDATEDPDGDGVTNFEESRLGTSPRNANTHSVASGGDVAVLIVRMLYGDGNAPAFVDANDNTTPDWLDAAWAGSNPYFGSTTVVNDIDGDGIPNAWEHYYGRWRFPENGMEMRYADASGDPDQDGVINLFEYRLGTHPFIADTDNDGNVDGSLDTDGDGLSDLVEAQNQTNPNSQDSDGDGWYDDEESRMDGGDPRDSEKKPELLSAEAYVQIESRWINAEWKEENGPMGYHSWTWYWDTVESESPSGHWESFGSNPPEYPRIEEGSASYSDYRNPPTIAGFGDATATLGHLSSMENGWGSSSGSETVTSSYINIPAGGASSMPNWSPTYPDTGSVNDIWNLDKVVRWNGAVKEIRLVWAQDKPRPDRLTPVTRSFVKTREQGSQSVVVSIVQLTIDPEATKSTSGGANGNGEERISADTRESGQTLTEKLTEIKVLQHTLDSKSAASHPPAASDIRICRWLDAYNMMNELSDSYPKYDRDRFIISLPESLFPGKQEITIKIATKRAPGTQDLEDAQTEIKCTKRNGNFESIPMILVADEPDDVWDDLSPGDEEMNDVTHIASPGGKIEVALPLTGDLKVNFSVAPYAHKVVVECYVVRGQGTTIPPTLSDDIERQFSRASDVFRQIHTEVVARGPYDCVLEDAAMANILVNTGDGDNNLAIRGSLMSPLHAEAKSVFDKVMQLSGAASNVVRVVLFPCDRLNGSQSLLAATLKSSNGQWGQYEGFVVVPYKSVSYWRMFAHEVGHTVSLDHSQNFAIGRHALMYRVDNVEDYGNPDDDYLIKRFKHEDVQRLGASPRPQFLQNK